MQQVYVRKRRRVIGPVSLDTAQEIVKLQGGTIFTKAPQPQAGCARAGSYDGRPLGSPKVRDIPRRFRGDRKPGTCKVYGLTTGK